MAECVSVAHVSKRGATPKFINTWTRSWRVVKAGKSTCVNNVQNIITEELRDADVASIRFNADEAMTFTADVKHAFQHEFDQGYVGMEHVIELAESKDGEWPLVLVGLTGCN